MLFSYNWLKELSGTKKSPEKLAELLMTHAFEVETIKRYDHGLDDIVIGRVESVKPHPDADRLRVTTVEVGRRDIRTIVCGAPNVEIGQKVAVVLPGGKLPGGTRIKEATLRGVTSHGMICSEKELGLGETHTGILVLDDKAPVGKSLASYAMLDDFVLDIKILPDRSSDALSYRGLAREIAALEGVTPVFQSQKKIKFRARLSSKVPKVTVKTDRCGRYLLALFTNVSVTSSPLWMKARLLVSGVRPINSVVDATNYLMLLTGQPMHAFDADAIAQGGLVIRQGKGREKLTLLDGKIIQPTRHDIVIADNKRALALAGIMGGKLSAVTEKTKNIAIEIAHFQGSSIRQSRKFHNLATDASYRFERGFDVERPGVAFTELLHLMERLDWGRYVGSRDIVRIQEKIRIIHLPLSLVEKVLGVTVPLFEVVQRLALLGLTVKKIANKKELSVQIPSERIDLRDSWDLIEEIGRTRGYDTILPVAPQVSLFPQEKSRELDFLWELKKTLSGLGFDEVMSYSFYNEKMAQVCGLDPENHLRIANPLNPEQNLMRTSLLPHLLLAAEKNSHSFRDFHMFEVGNVFSFSPSRPVESSKVACVSAVSQRESENVFFCCKGMIEALFSRFGITAIFEPMVNAPKIFHPTRMAVISSHDRVLGHWGEIHPTLLKSFGLRGQVIAGEFDVHALIAVYPSDRKAVPLRRYPLAYRDISLTGKKSITYAELHALLLEAGAPLLVEAQLFDVYHEGEETSYAFHLAFGYADRTIKSSEMDQVFNTIVKQASEKLGMRLRLS